MKGLIQFCIAVFYLHYYFVLAILTFFNAIKFIFKKLVQASKETQIISPFAIAHKDVFSSLYQLASCQGFTLQVYTFQTADKVSIEMWRVYKKDRIQFKPFPVLLMHGLLDCSISWFLQADKSKSLPYMLAEQGYQVWLGNNRGNMISQKQQHPDAQFWEFNLDHLIEHDQPTIIQGVLKASKRQKLIYVGHSQGSAQLILAMGVHKELSKKIACFVGLGALISMINLKDHFFLKLLDKLKLIQICKWLGFKRFLAIPRLLAKSVAILTYNCWIYYNIVMTVICMLCGFCKKDKVSAHFGIIITHQPGGSSSNNVLHWIQCFRNGMMRKFDYGPKKNIQVYGSQSPENYCLQHLRDLSFNTYLFTGKQDAMVSPQNFQHLVSKFHQDRIQWFQLDDYHHLDYIWSQTAYVDVYPKIIEIVDNCSNCG